MTFVAKNNSDFGQAIKYYFRESDQLPIGATASAIGRYDDVDTMSAICSWNTSRVTDMSDAFKNRRTFNQAVGEWDVSNVVNFSGMFSGAHSFNQALGTWNTSSATNMEQMFQGAVKFNQDIGDWNVSNVTNFSQTFFIATSFNRDISNWNVSRGEKFQFMFAKATSFIQSIRKWRVSESANLISMFVSASALQSLYADVSEFDSTPQYEFFNYVKPESPVSYGFDMAFQAQTVDQSSLVLSRRKLGRAHSALHSVVKNVPSGQGGSHQVRHKLLSTSAKVTLSISGERHVSSYSNRNYVNSRIRMLRG